MGSIGKNEAVAAMNEQEWIEVDSSEIADDADIHIKSAIISLNVVMYVAVMLFSFVPDVRNFVMTFF